MLRDQPVGRSGVDVDFFDDEGAAAISDIELSSDLGEEVVVDESGMSSRVGGMSGHSRWTSIGRYGGKKIFDEAWKKLISWNWVA